MFLVLSPLSAFWLLWSAATYGAFLERKNIKHLPISCFCSALASLLPLRGVFPSLNAGGLKRMSRRPQIMKISVSNEIRVLCPGVALGVLHYKVNVEPSSPELLEFFACELEKLSAKYTLERIAQNPHIASTRQASKALGKSPHDYRNAAEAMLRRVVK